MKRPEPRRSPLAALSPTTPATTQPAPPGTRTGNASRANPTRPEPSEWDKLTIRIERDLAGQARAAFWATSHLTGCRSLSEWIADAISSKLQHEEAEFNNGHPWEPIGAGTIPTGRRY
jgi:hypothetical protein